MKLKQTFKELKKVKTKKNIFTAQMFMSLLKFLLSTFCKKLRIGSESELLIWIQIRQINWDRCLSVGVDPVQFLLD